MKVFNILLGVLLATLFALGPGDAVKHAPRPHDIPADQKLSPRLPEPPTTEVSVGDAAPDFSYQSEDGRWRRLHDLLEQGPALIVFGAGAKDLTALEGERDGLLRLGVVPCAVLDLTSRSTWATARRLALRYAVVPDSRRVIAAQFNAADPTTQRAQPAWFVVDRGGRVRALRRGALPERGYLALAAQALGLPRPGDLVPTRSP